MTELNPDEIYFEPGSVVDPVGKVLHFGGRMFRAVAAPYTEFVGRTIKLASQEKWFDAGLVPTWRTSYRLPGYPLLIEHKRIPFVTLRGEWSGEGLRNAALCILNLSAVLLRSDLCLKDAHPWNILFDRTKPHFIDWGSIRPSAELNWDFWYRQFRQYLLAPLYVFSIGQPRIARAMLREHEIGVGNEIIYLPNTCNLPDAPRHIAEAASSPPSPETFESLANYVATLNIPKIEGEWTAYPQPKLSSYADRSELREKDRIVHRILERDDGNTLIDLGTNNGLHSEIAAALGKRVVACDIDETCLNSIYLSTQRRGCDILPLYHDFLWPIGTSGILNTIPAAEERLSCDTALVMALTHHLAFKQNISFEAMAQGISRLAKRRAIVEFVPAEDEHVALWTPERLPWYNLDNFIIAMMYHFKNYAIITSEPRPRCVVLFDKE
jgi:hypothetical protein